MHRVSEVEGILKNNADVWDLLKASFPAGTVTGAPKIRACLLYTSPSPRDEQSSRMPSSA